MAKTTPKQAIIVAESRIVRLKSQWARLQNTFQYLQAITKAGSIVLRHLQECLGELAALDLVEPGDLELDG